MPDPNQNTLYRCPLCEAPAPSVGACKTHITCRDDPVHRGWTGADWHDEILAGQTVADRAGLAAIRSYLTNHRFIDRSRRTARYLFSGDN